MLQQLLEGDSEVAGQDDRDAVAALRESERRFREMIDALPAAIYTTDAQGRITHFNPACVALSGRTPQQGSDHWCVTWKLYYPDGRPMPHDKCPMAIALKEGRVLRGAEAIAERPDGTRIWFTPYPTPLFDERGAVVGGINMLVDITERKQAEIAKGRLAAIVESSDDAIISKDLNSIIKSWNAGAERLFGYTAEEAIGKRVTMLMPADRVDEESGILERVRRGEVMDHYETVRRCKDGALVDISLTVSPITDEQGRIVGASKIARDITRHKRIEDAMRESEERFRMLADNMNQLAWTCDKLGNVTWYNQRWLDYTGLSFEEMSDWGWIKCHHPEHVDRVVASVTRSRETGEIWEDTFPLRGKDGQYRWFLSRAIPIRDEQGNIVRWFGTNTDITEQRNMAEVLRQNAAELAEANRRKDEFLAILAHELRGPLAPLRNMLQVMKRAAGDGELLGRARDTMERQLSCMVRLVDDLLDVSRITSGKVELKRQRVELASVVHQAVEAVRPLCDEASHALSVELPPERLYLQADPLRLAQVFSNLLNNSCKYTEPGGKIWLTTERQGSDVVVKVRDTGIGISPDKLQSVFEMFAQVDRSLERSQGGLGIGLTLVKRLVEMHGGSVEAASGGPGRGSEFTVRLPLLIGEPERRQPCEWDRTRNRLESRRILVVDDNRDSATSLAMLLKMMGNEMRTAHDGLEAVEAADAFRPDVILLDVGLPKLNGYDACRRIRQQSWTTNLVIVALTGWGNDEDRRKSKEAGFDHHLVKPVDPAALEELLADKLSMPV